MSLRNKFLITLPLLAIFTVISLVFYNQVTAKVGEADRLIVDLTQELKVNQQKLTNQEFDKVIDGVYSIRVRANTAATYIEKNQILTNTPVIGEKYRTALNALKLLTYTIDATDLLRTQIRPAFQKKHDIIGDTNLEILLSTFFDDYQVTQKSITPLIEALPTLKKHLNQIDPDKLPESYRGTQVRESFYFIRDMVNRFSPSQIAEHLGGILKLAGAEKPVQYLLMFQNNAELRPTGGFITAYGVIEVNKGKVKIIKSEDIYKMDERILTDILAPEPIRKIEVAYLNSRDSNLYPDFPTSAEKFLSYYLEDGNPKPELIMAIDTQVMVDLIKLTGPLYISKYPEPFTAEIHPSGIPEVLYRLEEYTQKPETTADVRKEILGDLLAELLRKLYSTPISQYPAMYLTINNLATEKHLLAHSTDKVVSNLLRDIEVNGELKQTDGDYLHINHSNLGGKKSNLFIDEEVTIDINLDQNGNITQEVETKMTSKNKEESWLNATYWEWSRMYVPKGSKLTGSSATDDVTSYQEADKEVFETYFYVYPGESGTFYTKYQLPFKYDRNKGLPFYIQKQPGSKSSRYTVNVNGRQWKQFNLSSDQHFLIKF